MNIRVIKADITTIKADAIVNAANTSLLGGSGVDGAIHRKGGKATWAECMAIRNKQGGCAVGEAVITGAGNLPAQFVIHTVGPVWTGGNKNEEGLLHACYTNSMKIAVAHNIATIAFPNISTGIYHFPKDRAAEIAIEAVLHFEQQEKFNEVLFVCFDEENYNIYHKGLHHKGLHHE